MKPKNDMRPKLGLLVVAVAVSQTVVWLVHWVLYQTIVFAYTLRELPPRVGIGSALIVLSVIFTVAQILISRWYERALNIFYLIAAVWIGTLHMLLLACGVFWVAAAVTFPRGIGVPWGFLAQGLLVLALAASAYGVYNSFHTRVTRYDIRLPNLPPAWRGCTAVMVSDTHLGSIRGVSSAEKMVRMVNAENPDIVFIPGDYFDGTPADHMAFTAPLRDIRARLGTYFIEGNHEEFQDPKPYLIALRAAGVKILDCEKVDVEGLQILGAPYSMCHRPGDLREALKEIPLDKNRPSILLNHAPTGRRDAGAAGISLMLSGHTHKAQVWPLHWVARSVFGRAVYGYSRKNGMQVITTSGFGTWGPPQRIGTKAEIVVIKFL